MASASQSSSVSQSTSNSFIPDYSETPILESIAQQAQAMSGTVYNWGMDRFNKNQGDIDGLMRDALSYASPQRISADMGMAESGVQQGAERGRQSAIQDLQSYGIDPSSGRYEALDSANRVMSAAAAAGAGNQQRMADIAAGNVMRNQAIAASNQNAQFGLGVGNSANSFLATAMNLKYPPLGTNSQSTSQSQSGSVTTDPPQQPKQQSQQPPQQQQQPRPAAAAKPAAPAKPQPVNEDTKGGATGGTGSAGGKGGDPKTGQDPQSPENDPNAPAPDAPADIPNQFGPDALPDPTMLPQPPPEGWPDQTTPWPDTGDQPAPADQPAPNTGGVVPPDPFGNLSPPDEQGLQPGGDQPYDESVPQAYNPYQDSPADTTALAGNFQAVDPVTGQPTDNPLDQTQTDQAGSLYSYDTTSGNWLTNGAITPTGYNPQDAGAAFGTSDPTAGTGTYDSTYGAWSDPGFSYSDPSAGFDPGTTDQTGGFNYTDPTGGGFDYTDPTAGAYSDPYANYDPTAGDSSYSDYSDPTAGNDYSDPYANYDFSNTDNYDYSNNTAGDGSDYTDYGGDSAYTDYTDPTAGSDNTDYSSYDAGGGDNTDYTDYGAGSSDPTGGSDYTDYSSYDDGGGDYARGGVVRRRQPMRPPMQRPMPTGYRQRPPGFARGGPLMMAPGSMAPPPGARPAPPPGAPRPARGAPMMAPGGPRPGPAPRGPMMAGNFISANGMPPPTQGGQPFPQRMAQGGQAGQRAEPTTGGFVSRSLSPSGGSTTDDVQARLNAGEFVIPRDIAAYKGKEFFYNLIAKVRRARATHGNGDSGVGYGANRTNG